MLPYTEQAEGMLTYTDDGHMAAFLHHPVWRTTQTVDDSNHMLFGAYAGRWSLKDRKVRHHVEFASAPSIIGTTLVRVVKRLTSSQLILASEVQRGAPEHLLEWRLR